MNQTGREAAREPHAMTSRPANGESVETALQLAIDLHGPALLSRPEKLARHLEAQCPQAATDIAFLLAALEEKVPQALLAVKTAADLQALEPQLVQGLCERRALNPFAATWTVSTWAAALRMDLFGTPVARSTTAVNGATPAYRLGPWGGTAPPEPLAALDDSAQRFGTNTTTAPMPFTVPFGIQPAPKAVPDAPSPVTAEPLSIAAEAGPIALPEIVATEAAAFAPLVLDPGPEALVPMARTAAAGVDAMNAEGPAQVADDAAASVPAAADDESLPDWMIEEEPIVWPAAPRRFNRWWGIAGVIVALLVAVGSIRIMSSMNGPEVPAAAPVAKTAGPRAAPAIVDVVSDAALIGDGTEHDVFVTVDPSRDDVRSVEATFMGGAGTWDKETRVIAVPPAARLDGPNPGRIAVGRIGLRTSTPATATFQYVLTTADGARSTPFVKQFAFAPVVARPPAIVDVIAPPGLVAGMPFTLTIDFTPGESTIASVERKPIGADETSDATGRVTSIAALASPKDGTLRYPFEAIASASRTTYAFTLVDRDGGRSEPKEVVIDVAEPKRTVTAVAATTTPAASVEPTACTRANCGSVVSVREIDRSKNYEVLLRMDDRSIQTLVTKNPPKVGARVRGADRRPAPVDVAKAAPPKPSTRAPAKLLPESPPIVDR